MRSRPILQQPPIHQSSFWRLQPPIRQSPLRPLQPLVCRSPLPQSVVYHLLRQPPLSKLLLKLLLNKIINFILGKFIVKPGRENCLTQKEKLILESELETKNRNQTMY